MSKNNPTKHERIWQCYVPLEDECDGPIRAALAAIEQIEGLPEDFEITEIKSKELRGIRVAFENSGSHRHEVQQILDQLSKETLEIEADLRAYEEAMEEYKKNPVMYSHEEVVKMLEEKDDVKP